METAVAAGPALICVAHLRWDFVFQRPQHLMTRAARTRPVYYVEEPVFTEGADPHADHLACRTTAEGVKVCVPHLAAGQDAGAVQATLARLLTQFVRAEGLNEYDLWFYTPMALPITAGLHPRLTLYDCMDELSKFRGAPAELLAYEQSLLRRADVVFTGGQRLFEAKRERHRNVHCFPSSVDHAHFARARTPGPDPQDQRDIPRPRLGFAGVIDERMDLELLTTLARRRPEWQFVLVGPLAKIDPQQLPRGENLHYLGLKPYAALPDYLGHWDAALLPFARNEATEFISPTKTPEYLAAGLPVVSSGIRDVVRPYGDQRLVSIAHDADGFEAAIELALSERDSAVARSRQRRSDEFLARQSWDRTWQAMQAAMQQAAPVPSAADD
ncbi:glycosyltransferase family 1 protein (plasmid) [Deinococcus metallilatus]|nr:glycosyltransferase family 1 protein [Deinococcus metallilatus]RXJ18170.1 glycosyltransferase family 1 protein [Deinococcus metallilatus]TLK32337.1 glycosyltransferase family 1 protein [Deinococcus metallilatus]